MNAVIKTLKDNLGSDFTPAIKKSWKVVLNVVKETMIVDNYEKKEILPEDAAEALLIPEDPALHKDNTYRNMESYAITVQNSERDLKEANSMRSDRNEDTMRPIAGGNDDMDQSVLGIENLGKQKT